MSWRQFFDVLGLPIQDWNDVWPKDERTLAEERDVRVSNRFHKIYSAMLRRRRAIERLKMEMDGAPADEAENCRRRILRHEARYQILLGQLRRVKRSLALAARPPVVTERLLS